MGHENADVFTTVREGKKLVCINKNTANCSTVSLLIIKIFALKHCLFS